MIAVVLAAASGLSYGASDFFGALASQKNKATTVTAIAQLVSLAALVVAIVTWVDGEILASDLAWGALGGLGAALGLVTFYRALAQGPMATAAALTALWGAAIPVATGLALGDRPGTITLVGIAIAVPAAVMVSVGGMAGDAEPTDTTPRERLAGRRNVASTRRLAVIAGIGFGLFFVAIGRTSADGGFFPLVGARLASLAALGIVLVRQREAITVARASVAAIVVTGLLDFGANAFYVLALRHGSFTWVAAISSLYPVSTVLLARLVLHERMAKPQIAGMCLAGLALTLVAVGATA